MESEGSSDHDKSKQRGPSINIKSSSKKRVRVSYNKKGVPIGQAATKLSTFEGVVARTMVKITFETWRDVPPERKQEIWDYISVSLRVLSIFL